MFLVGKERVHWDRVLPRNATFYQQDVPSKFKLGTLNELTDSSYPTLWHGKYASHVI